ncbi:MAG TPA: inorganic diphosphatase [Thermomicrobiales bacterium]|nr:inorganic diphosphatase [Thermomicrobiales bacterium]
MTSEHGTSIQAEHVKQEAVEVARESHEGNVLAFIEIPRGSRNKYEYDEEAGLFRLDRVLYSSVHYPTDYGFIPDTLAEDGDHLDILVLVQEPTFPGCMIETRPLGGLDMADEKGPDFKVLAVPVDDPRYSHVRTLEQIGDHWLREIETFFDTYKLLEPKQTEVLGWHDEASAREKIASCRRRYHETQAAK